MKQSLFAILLALGFVQIVRCDEPVASSFIVKWGSSKSFHQAVNSPLKIVALQPAPNGADTQWDVLEAEDGMPKNVFTPTDKNLSVTLSGSGKTYSRGAAWDIVYSMLAGKNKANFNVPREALQDLEPNFFMTDDAPDSKAHDLRLMAASQATIPVAQFDGSYNPAWPSDQSPLSHLKRTQLADAQEIVAKRFNNQCQGVTIAHLDTGYDPDQISRPLYFCASRSATFTPYGGRVPDAHGEADTSNHGTGTLGVLAGRPLQWPDGSVAALGGAPDANVFEVRINNGSSFLAVVHIATQSMYEGIDYAVEQKADVISISAGGLPSASWADAVNAAYKNGTVIVAAAGDFFTFPFFGFPLTPDGTVYPAAFRRVLGATGITKANRPYALRGSAAGLLPWNWSAAAMRGSFGPLSFYTDREISAYTPNVPWALKSSAPGSHPYFQLDGGGTFASTPQIAAAAALWLAYNKNSPGLPHLGMPNSWLRAEMVYHALEASANHEFRSQYCGTGILQARAALNIRPDVNLPEQCKARVGLKWLSLFIIEPALKTKTTLQHMVPDTEAIKRAYATEAVQIISTSPELQKMLERDPNYDDDKSTALRPHRIEILKKIMEDSNCSRTLRARIAQIVSS